jgi:hypothetical protein
MKFKCLADVNMTYFTGMKKGHTKMNARVDKTMESLYSSTADGKCFALFNGNHTSAACNESSGFLCVEMYVDYLYLRFLT